MDKFLDFLNKIIHLIVLVAFGLMMEIKIFIVEIFKLIIFDMTFI